MTILMQTICKWIAAVLFPIS